MHHHKRLIAALLAGVSAGASGLAGAQSSVTLFGTLDLVGGRFEGAATGVNALAEPAWRADGGGMSTSHLGVRGSEDLGAAG